MNAAPVSASIAAASGARSAGARNDDTTAVSGFAALFAQLEPAATQAEPTALPAPATRLQAEGDEPDGPDPALLAVLGLAPLPPPSPPAAAIGLGVPNDSVAADTGLTPGDSADVTLEGPTADRPPRAPWEQTALNLASLRSSAAAMASNATAGDAAAHAIDDRALAQRTIADGALPELSAIESEPPSATASVAASEVAADATRAGRPAAAQRPDETSPPASRASTPTAERVLAPDTPAVTAPRPAADFTATGGTRAQTGPGLAAADPNTAGSAAGDADSDVLLVGVSRADSALPAQRGDTSTPSTPHPQASIGAERAELASALRESLMPMAPVLPGARLEPGSPQFSATLGQQMLWMASQQVGRAELKLAPDELGPLEIRLEMNGDEVRAEFASRSAEVRGLLESQVPRLREMLAEHGFSLADAQIGQERAAYQDAARQREGFGADRGSPDEAEANADGATPAPPPLRTRLGLVDDYA